MMLYLAPLELKSVLATDYALPCTRARLHRRYFNLVFLHQITLHARTASPNSVKSTMRGSSWRSMSLMFIVACTLAWFRADKGLYALIERAMAYCWLRYWDKKRYNQTAIPFFHVSNVMGRVYLAYALNESVFFTYNSKSSQLCKAFSSITSIPLAQSHV